jgi:hypothetical protein
MLIQILEDERECQGKKNMNHYRLTQLESGTELLQNLAKTLTDKHNEREKDWHNLAESWKRLEEEAVATNRR